MDTAHWPQGIGIGVVDIDNKTNMMEDSSKSAASRGAINVLERKARPQKDQALICPRCNSTTTKFCYYNNYSLSQPRYFCKTCRRYWTEGGSLRNVPVGGGSRKNSKRPSSDHSPSSPSSSSANKKAALAHHGQIGNFAASENPKINFQGQDLNLAYPPGDQDYDNNITNVPFTIDNRSNYHHHHHHHQNPSSLASSQHHNFSSAMELLKSGMASRGLTSFMPMAAVPGNHSGNVTMFSSGTFSGMQEFKPSGGGLSFSLGGFGSGGFESNNSSDQARLLFPSNQDMKQQIPSTDIATTTTTTTTSSEFDQQNGGDQERDSGGGGGYWNGMLGGGSW